MTMTDFGDETPPDLTDREHRIAKAAARAVVEEMKEEFFATVGKAIVTKFFVIVGMLFMGFAALASDDLRKLIFNAFK